MGEGDDIQPNSNEVRETGALHDIRNAIDSEDVEYVRVCVERAKMGDDSACRELSFTDRKKRTTLMLAISVPKHPNPEMVRLILDSGKVDVNAVDWYGGTALSKAVSSARAGADIVAMLVEAGANVNREIDKSGNTIFIEACRTQKFSNKYSGGIRRHDPFAVKNIIIKKLVEAGANINGRNNRGWTALIHLADVGDEETVRLLVELGADTTIHDRSKKKLTALDYAKRYGNRETAVALGWNPKTAAKDTEKS